MVMLMLAYYLWVVTLLDVYSRCDGVLSSSTLCVRILYHATVVVSLDSLVRWDSGDWEKEDYLLEHLYP